MPTPKAKKVKEPSDEYETSEGRYLPVHDKQAALDVIFRDAETKYGLTLFSKQEQNALDLWHAARGERFYLHCLKRTKKVQAKPEEVIRQLCLRRLLDMGYDMQQIALEVPVKMGSTVHSKAADIVIYRESTRLTHYIIVELKQPKRRDGLDQLESYMNATGAPFGLWLNGNEQIVRYREEPNIFETLDHLPGAGETIDDVRAPRKKSDLKPLVNLRELVEQLEERVLANAGVSAFDEVFKLIFAKLYDENDKSDNETVEFRRRGSETPEELLARIQKLFVRATQEPGWNEIFDPAEKIQLTAQALVPCVSELEPYRFFGSDLDVLDAAFEHLINPEQKGDKGQYFTPRHVVRMCVEMLNPKFKERCLDPACGPCGFMIHTLKHVTESPSFKRKWGRRLRPKRPSTPKTTSTRLTLTKSSPKSPR